MIAQLRGKLIHKGSTEVIIDCGGVGYSALVSVNTSSIIGAEGTEVRIFTILIPREDSLTLYGFAEESEREAFRLITSISGIGPKIALGILSSLTVAELQEYLITNNLHALQKLPGIGKKTAERLQLELKDKISKLGVVRFRDETPVHSLIRQEAIAALVTLGYSPAIADKAVRRAVEEDSAALNNAELLIRKSLKFAMN
jgi:holliday junction DNA helicase RuvA